MFQAVTIPGKISGIRTGDHPAGFETQSEAITTDKKKFSRPARCLLEATWNIWGTTKHENGKIGGHVLRYVYPDFAILIQTPMTSRSQQRMKNSDAFPCLS